MKILVCVLILFVFSLKLNAQISSDYVVRLDTISIKKFSLSMKGDINIYHVENAKTGRIHVDIVRGSRPAANYDYSSIKSFNNSSFTSLMRRIARPGDKLAFELTTPDGVTLILVEVTD